MKRHAKRAKLKIRRAGDTANILRKSGGTKNGYGKITGETWNQVASEYAVPDFNSGTDFTEYGGVGGAADVATPTFRFVHDSAIQDGDRFVTAGIEYEVKAVAPYPTHTVVQVVRVNG